MTRTQRLTVGISILGALAVAAYAAVAAVQILVLNPLAAAPGLTLDEIHSAMSAEREDLGPGVVFLILGIGVVLAVVAAVVSIVTHAPPVVPATTFLALLMVGAVGYFVASFGPGMALADTFGISGADHSPWSLLLYVVSMLAGLALIAVAIVAAVRRRPGDAGLTSDVASGPAVAGSK